MSHEPCAIVGIGQTEHKTRRWDVSLGGLVREAARRALDDAQMDWDDIDAVVIGKAPDLFEGVMKPELYLPPNNMRRGSRALRRVSRYFASTTREKNSRILWSISLWSEQE